MAYIVAIALAALAGAFFVIYRQQDKIDDLTERLVARNQSEYLASVAAKVPAEPEPEYQPRLSFFDQQLREKEREQ